MKFLEFVCIILGIVAFTKLFDLYKIYFGLLKHRFKIEERRLNILEDIDKSIEEQDELLSTHSLYKDLGQVEKCKEIEDKYQEINNRYRTLKSRII